MIDKKKMIEEIMNKMNCGGMVKKYYPGGMVEDESDEDPLAYDGAVADFDGESEEEPEDRQDIIKAIFSRLVR